MIGDELGDPDALWVKVVDEQGAASNGSGMGKGEEEGAVSGEGATRGCAGAGMNAWEQDDCTGSGSGSCCGSGGVDGGDRERGEDSNIVAFAKWVRPKPGVEPDTSLPLWPTGANKPLCEETFGAWAREHVRLMGTRGHWCKLQT